jgi:hypothetical protein
MSAAHGNEKPVTDLVEAMSSSSGSGLTEADIDMFIDRGYCVVKSAFSKETAHACREWMWEKMERDHGVTKHNTPEWPVKLPIGECYGKEMGSPWADVYTKSLERAIDEICGENQTGEYGCGWWMITFPQQSESPDADWKPTGSWHIDGQHYNHYPYCREIGCTPIMYFSDVHRNWGGTAVAEGSHHHAARILRQKGLKGIQSNDMTAEIQSSGVKFNIVELTGESGDVIMMHPLVVHARSTNLGPHGSSDAVRFMCHPSVPLKREMQFGGTKSIDEYTVLEISIICGAAECTSNDWRRYCEYKKESCNVSVDSVAMDVFSRIDLCIADLHVINPTSVARFLESRAEKRCRNESEGTGDGETVVGANADDVPGELEEAMGFSGFKCSRIN